MLRVCRAERLAIPMSPSSVIMERAGRASPEAETFTFSGIETRRAAWHDDGEAATFALVLRHHEPPSCVGDGNQGGFSSSPMTLTIFRRSSTEPSVSCACSRWARRGPAPHIPDEAIVVGVDGAVLPLLIDGGRQKYALVSTPTRRAHSARLSGRVGFVELVRNLDHPQ